MKIAIIGAGAAGLVAAVRIKKAGHIPVLFERETRAGKKLLATGNGRCNITNMNVDISRYHGDTAFADYALSVFGRDALIDFFGEIGVFCINEGDKVFPMSLQASSVLDMLRLAEGLCERCDEEVAALKPNKGGISVITTKSNESFDRVIVCCGGLACKKLSGGGAYELLTSLGHTLTPLKPSIVQLKCKGTKALEGIKVNAGVKLLDKCEEGEVLFTAYGLSGPPILQLSRDAKGETLMLDLTPTIPFGELLDMLSQRREISYITLENFFTGFLNKKIGRELLKKAGVGPLSRNADSLSDKEIKKLAALIKAMPFEIEGTTGFENAQVTAGGILCSEFDPTTMESRKVKGLYAAGELLDVDGDCGGFNLQWAFSSASLAAQSACGDLNA